MATGYNVRVGDADREAVAAQLREHYADGRLTLEELNERLDQAFAAKTKADLNTVMRDLPQAARPGAGMPYGGTAWQGAAPMAPRPDQDYRNGGWGGSQRQCGGSGLFAPLMGLAWLALILGSMFLFGLNGDRPLAIVLLIAALALVKRLFGLFGIGRRRGYRGPRGPRGPRGRRRY